MRYWKGGGLTLFLPGVVMVRKLAVFALLLSLFLVPLKASDKLASILPLTWDGRNHCTTFSINEAEGFWSVAGHCVVEPQNFMINGEPAVVLLYSAIFDSAVLVGPHAPALHLAPKPPKTGEKITVVGFPFGIEGLINPRSTMHGEFLNTFTDEDGTWNLYDLTAAPGNSGSPVFTSKGVIGTLNFGWSNAGRLGGGTTWEALKGLVVGGIWEQ